MNRTTLLSIIYLSVAVLIVAIILSAQVAPVFTACVGGIILIALLFILSENMFTHDAVEFENRFWTLIAFVLAWTFIFCQDSPVRFPENQTHLAYFTLMGFTFFAHNYERHLRREFLSRVSNIRRMRSADFGTENRTQAQTKVMELRKLIAIIDHKWFSSAFLNFFFLPRVLYVEHKIINILSEANSSELNLIISSVQLALIFYKVKDHKIARRFNRTKLLTLLFVDRVNELNTTAKATLLDSLQRMKLSAHPQSETFVKNLILKSKLDDLSELKSITDSKGDVNSMHALVYTDIRSKDIQSAILKYISDQARIQASHNLLKTKSSRQRSKFAWRKILSDVDDTLYCCGGSWPAGMDTSYPKKALYPGVTAFYRELDLGTTGSDSWDSSRIGNLVFLSARPHVYKDMSENVSYKKFKLLQEQRRLHTSPTLLAGSLDTGGKFMVSGDSEGLAQKKFANFREYLALYPEYTCVFVGDNGQGDVRCGEMMLADKTTAPNIERLYMHQIQPLHLTFAKEPSTKKKQLVKSKLYYFGTYVDAAIDAHHHRLILSKGLLRIMEEAVEDFALIPQSAWSQKAAPKTAKPAAANDAAAAAAAPNGNGTKSEATPAAAAVAAVVPAVASAAKGAAAKISTTIIKSTPLKTPARRKAASRQLPLVNNLESMETLYWEVKRELRIRELNRDIERGNAILRPLGLGPAPFVLYPERFSVGTQIQTLFGKGVIVHYRPSDGIYEVQVQWTCGSTSVAIRVFLTGITVNIKA